MGRVMPFIFVTLSLVCVAVLQSQSARNTAKTHPFQSVSPMPAEPLSPSGTPAN